MGNAILGALLVGIGNTILAFGVLYVLFSVGFWVFVMVAGAVLTLGFLALHGSVFAAVLVAHIVAILVVSRCSVIGNAQEGCSAPQDLA
jgi:purine-cytosine permease-like protein